MELLEQLQTALGSHYTIERELSGGAMGRVYLATDRALSRRVVIKVLSPGLAAGVSARRFDREIRLAASLQQANIVPVLSAEVTGGVPHYVMPYVDGLSLRERLARDGPPPLPEAVGMLRDVARALAHAHAHGVVHRDIKPANVLLSGGTAMVIDFGIAKAISAARDAHEREAGASTTVTQAGTAIGTPAYMSPEQVVADARIDHRSDLYSFGCLAYELISGRSPFADRTAPQVFAAHLAEMPRPLDDAAPDCPPALARLVMRCLAKDPARRPASAGEILAALDAMSVSASAFHRLLARPVRRHRVIAALLATGTLLVAAVWVRDRFASTGGPPAAPSLAVLPFVNIGDDSTRDVWADGLTDEVTTVLARRPDVRLAMRTSVERFRGRRTIDPRQAGELLQVSHVLHGTLWPVGRRVRVQVWLNRSGDGAEVWSETYERGAADILSALDSLTRGITVAIERRLLGASAPSLPGSPAALRGTSDTAAYDLYLRGQVLMRSRGNGVPRAARYFAQAVAHDSGFGRAYASLAAALAILPNFTDTTNQELEAPAIAAAGRALALDSTLAQARAALALVAMHGYHWARADSEFRRALALDPGDAATRMQYARYFTYTGDLDRAVRELQHARTLDPTSAVIGGWLAEDLLLAGRRPEAFAEIDRALEVDSSDVPMAFMGAQVAVARGQIARARRLIDVTWNPGGVPRAAPWPAAAALLYADLGDTAAVGRVLRHIDTAPPSRAFGHASLALAALARGDTARVLDELGRATDAGEFWPSAPILILPELDGLRANPRFAALIRRVGLDVARFTSPRAGRPR